MAGFPSSQVPISNPDTGDINAVWYLFFSGLPTKPPAPTVVSAATYTVAGDSGVIANFAGTVTLTLPAAGTFPGRALLVKTIQAQAVVSDASNVVPLAGGAAGTAILAATAGKWATLQSDGSAWQIMAAN